MKVAFVGNSHLVAYKAAEDQIKARHNGVEVSYFTVRNPDFFRNGLKNPDGLPYDAVTFQDGHAAIDPDGPDRLSFEGFDHVFLTAHGFYLGPFLELLARYDILDLHSAGRAEMMSWPCLRQIMEARLKHYARRLNTFFPLGPNVTIVQTPFPAAQALQTHPHLADALQQPDVNFLFERYNTLIDNSISSLNAKYQPVPLTLLDGPFITDPTYARSLALAPASPVREADNTHMNAAFALQMLDRMLE